MSLGIYAWYFKTDRHCFSSYIQIAASLEDIKDRIGMKTYKGDRWTQITCDYAHSPLRQDEYTTLFFIRNDGTEVTYKSIKDLVLNEQPNIYDEPLFNGIVVTGFDN